MTAVTLSKSESFAAKKWKDMLLILAGNRARDSGEMFRGTQTPANYWETFIFAHSPSVARNTNELLDKILLKINTDTTRDS